MISVTVTNCVNTPHLPAAFRNLALIKCQIKWSSSLFVRASSFFINCSLYLWWSLAVSKFRMARTKGNMMFPPCNFSESASGTPKPSKPCRNFVILSAPETLGWNLEPWKATKSTQKILEPAGVIRNHSNQAQALNLLWLRLNARTVGEKHGIHGFHCPLANTIIMCNSVITVVYT